MQQVFVERVERQVIDNDLIFLLAIGDYARTAKLFPIPRVPRATRSSSNLHDGALARAKGELIAAIKLLAQQSETTNLGEPIDLAASLLATQPRAISRNLVIASRLRSG